MSISRRRMLTFAAAGVAAAAIDPGGVGRAAQAAADLVSPGGPRARAGGGTTLERTVLPGPPDAKGYRKLTEGAGEKHLLRTDITSLRPEKPQPLVAFGHLSDLHVTDDQSPSRVEFLDRYNDDPDSGYPFGAAYRPHEFLSLHLVDAMCRSLKELGQGPRTALPLTFTVITGDAVDNAQLNEVRWYIDLLDGGKTIRANSGSPDRDESIANGTFGKDTHYWRPEEPAQNGNKYSQRGFPRIQGLLHAARRPFTTTGLDMPWYAVYGNHDVMVQGNIRTDTDLPFVGSLKEHTESGSKWSEGPELPDKLEDLDLIDVIKAVFDGVESHNVTADPSRRLLTPAEFVEEHQRTSGLPLGHGFEQGSDKTYYVLPAEEKDPIRYITLDTTNPAGLTNIHNNADGGIDQDQFTWLEEHLKEFSSTYFTESGTPVRQQDVEDKLIVIFCHHTLATMDNTADDHHSGDELRDLLLRFPNVILIANGHTHRNEITPHTRPADHEKPGGFWEISAASHIDWPIHSRVIEITAGKNTAGEEALAIFTTVLDIDAPLNNNGALDNPRALASLARELAVNDIQLDETHRGEENDRNAELLLPAPFPLSPLTPKTHKTPTTKNTSRAAGEEPAPSR
ncbi:metallophosphoesterase, PPA1498 family [Streptomyces sp. WMMB 714]|uniref:TIGR03767 family metallophosphoesterase n=1 Tax=Streptomyces sp. WMMB 714 TaxID=1286822 RepID=UPI000823E79C|nr:TIGR03767 family metallophosphoesterase [Streptomyces sp. WMMB 714]SCK13635.1 metallophosphoesterase, PPA1498 family [Streptomyces sp. WMMB 714]